MPLYYLPGRNGRLDLGLGAELISRGIDITGREQHGDFARLSFQQKIECIANDLRHLFVARLSSVSMIGKRILRKCENSRHLWAFRSPSSRMLDMHWRRRLW